MNKIINNYIAKNNIKIKYYKRNIGKYTWGFYRTFDDSSREEIILCKRSQYSKPAKLLVLYHELAHSTGHPKRLSRKSLYNYPKRDSIQWNKEEAIAEITAALFLMRNKKNKYILNTLIHGKLEQYFYKLPTKVWEEAKIEALLAYCYIDEKRQKDKVVKDFANLIKLLNKEWKL